MLKPRKHLDLDTSVLRVSAIVLKELQAKSGIEFERLRSYVIRRAGADAELSFLPALGLLYVLGKIEYHPQNDLVEYLAR